MKQSSLAERFLNRASPEEYLQNMGFMPYVWQLFILQTKWTRMLLNCARQSGKSTIIAALAWFVAKTVPRSLILIFAPTERQSLLLAEKLMAFAKLDDELDDIAGPKSERKLKNGSTIFSLPGTEKNIRGFSDPDLIIIDEAARTESYLYRALRPMLLTGKPRLIAMTTPFGTEGWFWEEWDTNPTFQKVLVKAPVAIIEGEIVPVTETEKHFSRRMKRDGISGFYSPRHSLKFMREEWLSMPEWWYRQEYLGQFMEAQAAVFSQRDLERALSLDPSEFTDIHEAVEDEEVNIVAGLWE